MYVHLGESDCRIVNYERGTAHHLFGNEEEGVTIMLEADVAVTLPDTIDDWRAQLEPRE